MFKIRWRMHGIHFHCRIFAAHNAGNGWAKIGDLVMDKEDWENFQLSILAKHWSILHESKEDKEDDKG